MPQPKEIGTQKDLVLYRIETAKEDMKSAKILKEASAYRRRVKACKEILIKRVIE